MRGTDWRREAIYGRMCRAELYRNRPGPPGADPDMALRDAIQQIALEFPSYGWRPVTAELLRRGWAVNHKRVYCRMREDTRSVCRRGGSW